MLLKTILEMSYNTYTGMDTDFVSKCFTCYKLEVWSNFPR